jgi:chromosome segregation ATPase
MGRVTVHVADSLLSALDEEAHNKSISRSQAVAKAIELLISGDNQAVLDAHNKLSEAHNKLSASEEDIMRLKQELSKLENQIAEKNNTIESNSSDVMRLEEDVKRIRADLEQAHVDNAQLELQIDQAADLKNELDQLKTRYNQSLSEATERWEELKSHKSEVTKLKKLLEESQATIQHLKDDLLKRQSETDQLATLREELAVSTTRCDGLQSALKVRDDDIAYFKSHVAQLTQSISQLSLKPGEDEIKRKGWSWRFWRR